MYFKLASLFLSLYWSKPTASFIAVMLKATIRVVISFASVDEKKIEYFNRFLVVFHKIIKTL